MPALYVVQRDASIAVELSIVGGSFAAAQPICELFIRRIGPLRGLFGIEVTKPLIVQPEECATASGAGVQPSA